MFILCRDRMADVEAGHRTIVQSIFIRGTEESEASEFAAPECVAKDTAEVVQHIVKIS